MSTTEQKDPGVVRIRPLREADLDEADRIMRTAFGTFLGAPDPVAVFGDVQLVRPRYAAEPGWAFAAELDGEVVGSNFATRWGSFGFLGPLTVRPDLWDRGIGAKLVEPVVDLFDRWQVRLSGLFTFPHSAKHLGLYQKFGFWPQALTPVLERRLEAPGQGVVTTFSGLGGGERESALAACREVTDAVFAGLDVEHEIRAADAQALGDTVLVENGAGVSGFAVCHCGAGEAGSGTCFVKFGAVRPGRGAAERFERLLDACEVLAAERGLERISAGVNSARHDAYRRLLARGYRAGMTGVIMQRPNDAGYCREDAYVIDDLR